MMFRGNGQGQARKGPEKQTIALMIGKHGEKMPV